MKKILLCLAIRTCLFAYDYKSYDETYNNSEEYKYQGSSGAKYKYDLSKPMDKLNYETDSMQQMKDSYNPDARIQMDRDMGQYGGGYGR